MVHWLELGPPFFPKDLEAVLEQRALINNEKLLLQPRVEFASSEARNCVEHGGYIQIREQNQNLVRKKKYISQKGDRIKERRAKPLVLNQSGTSKPSFSNIN